MMERRRKLVVFCSASYDIDPYYNQAAREFVRAACLRDYIIVSGGTVKGTMGEIADEIEKCGGTHVGIIPRFMEDVEYPGLNEKVYTETMSARKEAMREGTCFAVALPGGIGTLDELFETLTLAKLGKYNGRVAALNLGGFFDPMEAMLDHLVETRMLDKRSRSLISFPSTVGELVDML